MTPSVTPKNNEGLGAPVFGKKETIHFNVSGMTCGNCVGHVTKALQGVSGVKSVNVYLDGHADVVCKAGSDEQAMIAAIKDAGYDAEVA